MKWIPTPIVMGMIVGVMIRFTTEMITSVTISPLLAGSAILVFLLSSRLFEKGSACFICFNRGCYAGRRYRCV